MVISGKANVNNTGYMYILPCLRAHGEELMRKLRKVYKLGVAVGDDNDDLPIGEYIYIVIDTTARNKFYLNVFSDFMQWVREEPYYKKDYTLSERAHVLVLRYPDEFYDICTKLSENKYLGLYTKEQLDLFYRDEYISMTAQMKEKIYNVVIGNPEYFPTFVKEVNEKFAVCLSEDDFDNPQEMGLGLILSENVLNVL